MNEKTKICRMCGEEIKAVAKRCPHCTHFQSKITPAVIGIIVLASLLAIRLMMPSYKSKETLYDAHNKLDIVEQSISMRRMIAAHLLRFLASLKIKQKRHGATFILKSNFITIKKN